jgi:hypothetical protein
LFVVLAMTGVVVLAVRPDWKEDVSRRVRDIRSRLVPEFQELVGRMAERTPSERSDSMPKGRSSAAVRDPLAEVLAMQENATWKAWSSQRHELTFPSARWTPLSFRAWSDPSDCVERWDGSTRILRDDCIPKRFQVDLMIDSAAAEAIQAHYGMPNEGFWFSDVPDSRETIEEFIGRTAALHGIRFDRKDGKLRYRYAPEWLVQVSAPFVRDVAASVVLSVTGGRAESVSERQIIKALTGYVQVAVPYVAIESDSDGKYREGLRSPLMTLLKGGDCDSKCLLLASMIHSLRPELPMEIMFVRGTEESTENDHAVLAVGIIPLASEWGRNMSCGRRGVLIETTAGWGMGNGFNLAEFSNLEALPIP